MRVWLKRKRKSETVDDKRLSQVLKRELGDYVRREELCEYLEKMRGDERKRQLWDSMPTSKKLRLLRYALGKKEGQHGQK